MRQAAAFYALEGYEPHGPWSLGDLLITNQEYCKGIGSGEVCRLFEQMAHAMAGARQHLALDVASEAGVVLVTLSMRDGDEKFISSLP